MFSKESFKRSIGIIFLILGIIGYAICFCLLEKSDLSYDIIIKISDILVIGVVLGFVSNAAMFFGIFKSDLYDIIYSKEFLKKQKDINCIWEKVSAEFIKDKFPTIHEDFLNTIKGYFPIKDDDRSFYNDYDIDAYIEWVDRNKGIIKVVDITSFAIISDTEDEIIHPIITWSEDEDSSCKLLSLTVNGKSEAIPTFEKGEDIGKICERLNLKLSGKRKYKISLEREKIYNINTDYYYGFRSQYIAKSLCVSLTLPEDIEAIFVSRGTLDEFSKVKKTKTHIKMKYESVILPKQGFIFALRNKVLRKEEEGK